MEFIYILLFVFVYWLIRKFSETERYWQRQFAQQAMKDSLTGLYNQRYLSDYLATQASNCLIIVDLDNFKSVNDSYGHIAGDVFLKITAQELQRLIDPGHIILRYGGDEFVIIPHNIQNSKEAYAVGSQVQKAIASAYEIFIVQIEKQEVNSQPVTGSVGIVYTKNPTTDYSFLVNAADRALYHSKNQGKNTIHLVAL